MAGSIETKLDQISAELSGNKQIVSLRVDRYPEPDDLVILGLSSHLYNGSEFKTVQLVDFIVAPIDGINPKDEIALQYFMLSLTSVDPSQVISFEYEGCSSSPQMTRDTNNLRLGMMIYGETLGLQTIRKSAIETDYPNIFAKADISTEPQNIQVVAYRRITTIRPYPNLTVAQLMAEIEILRSRNEELNGSRDSHITPHAVNTIRDLQSRITETQIRQLLNGKNPFTRNRYREVLDQLNISIHASQRNNGKTQNPLS